jgi:hypothetical protein
VASTRSTRSGSMVPFGTLAIVTTLPSNMRTATLPPVPT